VRNIPAHDLVGLLRVAVRLGGWDPCIWRTVPSADFAPKMELADMLSDLHRQPQ